MKGFRVESRVRNVHIIKELDLGHARVLGRF